jgi:5-(carboxyamino)imidazole ribonucleotide mutase
MKKNNPLVTIVLGSTSDWKVMEKAAQMLDDFKVPFEIQALSAHRTPEAVVEYIKTIEEKGAKVIIAGAGLAAHLPGVIASHTTLPVIGVPVSSSISLNGWDAVLSILQMPPGIPVATVGLDNAMNAAILALQMLALTDDDIRQRVVEYKSSLKNKIIKANETFKEISFEHKVN